MEREGGDCGGDTRVGEEWRRKIDETEVVSG